MRFVKLSAKEIVELVRENETVKVECKEALGGLPDSLWETYSSFANTDGGVILLGVKELKNRKMQIQGVADPAALIKQFWNTVNNREKVSANILFDRHVYSVDCDGKAVVVVEVPRADRQTRPVYVGEDMFKGTYRRNGEGDYHCPRESVKALIRDQLDRTADQTVVDKLTFDDLNKDTIRFYRRQFKDIHPNLTWNELPDEEFLTKIGAMGRDEDGKLRPNIAGLVCFGDFVTIMHTLPNYFLDYREKRSDSRRWDDRVCASDPTWSGNIIDFYYRIYDKIVAAVDVPFALKEGRTRIDETDVHVAVREVLANALIHADYHGRQGIVVERRFNEISVSNPGTLRPGKEVAVDGGTSDPRNANIFNIFSLLNVGERSGTGLSNLFAVWERERFQTPVVQEQYDPDRTSVLIVTASASRSKTGVKAEYAQNGQEADKNLTRTLQETHTKPIQNAHTEPTLNNSRSRIGVESEWNRSKTGVKPISDLTSSTRRVFRALCEDVSLTYVGLMSKLNLSNSTVAVAIGTLIKEGYIRRVGPKKGGHWEIVKR